MSAQPVQALADAIGRSVRRLGPAEVGDLQVLFDLQVRPEGGDRDELRAGVASLIARSPEEWRRVAQLVDHWFAGELDAQGRMSEVRSGTGALLRPAPLPGPAPVPRRKLVDWLLGWSQRRLVLVVGVGLLLFAAPIVWTGLEAAPHVLLAAGGGGEAGATTSAPVATVQTVRAADPERTIDAPAPLRLSPGAYAALASAAFLLGFIGHTLRRFPDAAAKAEGNERRRRETTARDSRARIEAQRVTAGAPPVDLWDVPVFSPLAPTSLASAAASLARLRVAEGRVELDLPRTLDRTIAAGGRFDPALRPRSLPRRVLVLAEVPAAGEHPWSRRCDRVVDALAMLGVEVERWAYQEQPDLLKADGSGLRLSVVDLARRTADLPVIVFGRALSPWGRDGRRERPWVGARKGWGRMAWVDPDPAGMAERALEALDVRRFPLTEAGLEAAARWVAGDDGADGGADPRVFGGQEALWRWALAAALVPEATWDQLEAIRQGFPELSTALPGPWAVRALLAWVAAQPESELGVVSDSGGELLLSPSLVDRLLRELRARRDPELLAYVRQVDEMLLDQLGTHAPPDELGRALWELKTSWIRTRLDPARASELLARVLRGPLSRETKELVAAELRRQRDVPLAGADWGGVDQRVVGAEVVAPGGVPLGDLLFRPRMAWPRWQRTLGMVVVYLAAGVGGWYALPAAGRAGLAPRLQAKLPGTYTLVTETGELRPEMVEIPAGSFVMGSPEGEEGRRSDEKQHAVRITRPFLLAKTEVTQAQYRRVMGEAPFSTDYRGISLLGDDLPAHSVSWEDAVKYCNRLSGLEGLDPAYTIGDETTWNRGANGYRLPTDAEWEYAARAGTNTEYVGTEYAEGVCGEDNVADASVGVRIPEWRVFACDDGVEGLAAVGHYQANPWGLFDMGGNVAEWAWDRFGEVLASGDGPVVDNGDSSRVFRGGSWGDGPQPARAADRWSRPPSDRDVFLGFRPARSPDP